MRTGLIAFGVLLMVLGAMFYYIPRATTTVVSASDSGEVNTIRASAILPVQITIGGMILGVVLFILGLSIPDAEPRVYVAPEHKEIRYQTRRYKRHYHRPHTKHGKTHKR